MFGKFINNPKKPLMASIPHSGEQIPPETPWLVNLPEPLLMFDVDRYVDRLYTEGLEKNQIPLVITPWHRYAADLNRLDTDIDAGSVEGNANPLGQYSRGFHWSMTTRRESLMPKPMPLSTHNQIVELYYKPFHAALNRQRDQIKKSFGVVYHVDLHSMPSLGTSEHRDPGEKRADIVVSDCKGKSCAKEFKDLVIESYKAQGFSVAYNWPYFGGRLTEQYGQPADGFHSIQIELNRGLYMDENSKKFRPELAESLKDRLRKAIETIYNALD